MEPCLFFLNRSLILTSPLRRHRGMHGHEFQMTQLFIKAGAFGSSLRFAQIQFHHHISGAAALTCMRLKNDWCFVHLLTLTIRFSPFSLLACVHVEHIVNPSVRVYFLYPLDVLFSFHTLQSLCTGQSAFFMLISEFFIYHFISFGCWRKENNLIYENQE